jgi:hypothetical protein
MESRKLNKATDGVLGNSAKAGHLGGQVGASHAPTGLSRPNTVVPSTTGCIAASSSSFPPFVPSGGSSALTKLSSSTRPIYPTHCEPTSSISMRRGPIRGSSSLFLAHRRPGQPLARWSAATCLEVCSTTTIVRPDFEATQRVGISCYYRVLCGILTQLREIY